MEMLTSKASLVFIILFSAAFADVPLQGTGGTVKLKPDGSYGITVPEGHYVEINITFLENYGYAQICYYDTYLEIRDGLGESAPLLGVFCDFQKGKEYIFRSSGRHMWLKLHRSYRVKDDDFHVNYSAKQMNATVAPNLYKMKTTQHVLYDHSLFLWCPAEGAPAPFIVWRKNGVIVQNTTSIRYEVDSVKGNNETFSCEVKNGDNVTKKELVLYMKRCPGPCQCSYVKGTHSLLWISCRGKQLRTSPWTVPVTLVATVL